MKIVYILAASAILVISGCDGKAKPDAQAAPPDAKLEALPGTTYSAPDTFKTALGKVFDGYEGIQIALAQDDLPKAKKSFSTMHAVLHIMPKEGLDSAASAYWDTTDARIMAILHPMASADSLEAARAYFMDFSVVLSEAIGKFGLAGTGPIYHFHCPMARDNQGADWLQKDSVPANPYFGSAMPRCGDLVRVLKG